MSNYERHKGKIRKIDLNKISMMDYLVQFAPETERENLREKYNDNIYHMLYECSLVDDMPDKFIIVKDELYEIIESKRMDVEMDIYDADSNSDGTISFHVMYYNGGCGLTEAIEEAIENMKN